MQYSNYSAADPPLRRSKSRLARIKDSLFVSPTYDNSSNPANEKSAFSPDTPTNPLSEASTSFNLRFGRPSRESNGHGHGGNNEPGTSSSAAGVGFRNHINRFVTSPKTSSHGHDEYEANFLDEKAFQNLPSFKPSRPLVKPLKFDEDDDFKRTLKRRRIRILVVALTIVLLVIVAIILLVRLVRPQIKNSAGQISGSSLSQEQSQCISGFINEAANDPASYQCGSCLPTLQAIPPEFLSSAQNADNAERIQAAIQFCGLRSLFDSTAQEGQSQLSAGGWMRDIKTCTWAGATCDGSGQVSVLELSTPAVPSSIPDLSILKSITRLKLTGNHAIPSAALPSKFPASLKTLELFNTAIAGIDNSFFASTGTLFGLTALTLDGNTAMGTSLPQSLSSLSLQSLVVKNQNLDMSLDSIFNSPTFGTSLVTLDLSFNALNGTLPSINLPNLKNLDLSSNGIDEIANGTTFPPSLTTLSFKGNSDLHGVIPGSVCSQPSLTTCSFENTRFSAVVNVTCGACKF